MNSRLTWQDVREIVDRHTVRLKAAAATPWHGLGLGNADMGAVVYGPPYRLMFRMAKICPLTRNQAHTIVYRTETRRCADRHKATDGCQGW